MKLHLRAFELRDTPDGAAFPFSMPAIRTLPRVGRKSSSHSHERTGPGPSAAAPWIQLLSTLVRPERTSTREKDGARRFVG